MTSETQKKMPTAKPSRPMHERAIRAAKGPERKSAETAVLSDDFQIALAQELVATGDVIADLIGDTMLDPWDDSSIEIVSSPGDTPAVIDLNSASSADLVAGDRASRSATGINDERAARHGGRGNSGDQQADPSVAIVETQAADGQGTSGTDNAGAGEDDPTAPDQLSEEESSFAAMTSSSPAPDKKLSPWQRRQMNKADWRRLTTMEAIVRLAWKHALTRETGKIYRQLMASSRQALIIVVVPSVDWHSEIRNQIDTSSVRIIEGDSVSRSGLSKSGSELEEALQKQKSVIYLTTDLSKVPPILQASHDLLITIPPPDADLIRALLRLTGTGTLRSTLDPDFIRSFDLIDFSVALRAGEPIEASIARLHQIKSRRSKALGDVNVPLLSETAAYGEAGDWGRQLATDIADYRRGKIAWGHIDRGAVIYGPPGTGKSYFARSLARTCEIPIVITSAGEWFATSAGHLDSVIKAVRKVFDEARQKAPAILFIDEIDAIPNRETLTSRNGDWWLPVVNDILLLLDNATSDRAGVIVIGATNRPNAIDPAILRPGRLERAVELAPTTLQGAVDILRHHLKEDLKDVDLLPIARVLEGRTAADLMEIVRSARRNARLRNQTLALGDLEQAMNRKTPLSQADLYRTAVHEAGHAIARLHFGYKIDAVILSPSGNVGGRVLGGTGPDILVTREDLIARCVTMLAGRAAEEVILGSPSIGSGGDPASDLAQATSLLREMHQSYGFGRDLVYAPPTTDKRKHRLPASLRRAIAADLDAAYAQAIEIISDNKDKLLTLVEVLLARRYLKGDEMARFL